ncbi:hypothetical protein T265_02892 [Opisthorchis viverrini]|uniref:Uncharacterized protein n=1 Tax=Opisthorchis viverrini TaxID=6198 RepID=A0A074ZUG0_OPIVI|nr:hypothetical protein T265_02892 [Opisthorchis viverrini]KER30746.1 hypothetical protein T265_02892 [Opisthorchis viverrini]
MFVGTVLNFGKTGHQHQKTNVGQVYGSADISRELCMTVYRHCNTPSVPSCHATKRKHEDWDNTRLPKPKERKSRGGGRVRITAFLSVNSRFPPQSRNWSDIRQPAEWETKGNAWCAQNRQIRRTAPSGRACRHGFIRKFLTKTTLEECTICKKFDEKTHNFVDREPLKHSGQPVQSHHSNLGHVEKNTSQRQTVQILSSTAQKLFDQDGLHKFGQNGVTGTRQGSPGKEAIVNK